MTLQNSFYGKIGEDDKHSNSSSLHLSSSSISLHENATKQLLLEEEQQQEPLVDLEQASNPPSRVFTTPITPRRPSLPSQISFTIRNENINNNESDDREQQRRSSAGMTSLLSYRTKRQQSFDTTTIPGPQDGDTRRTDGSTLLRKSVGVAARSRRLMTKFIDTTLDGTSDDEVADDGDESNVREKDGTTQERLSSDTFSFLISAPIKSIPFWTGFTTLVLKIGVYYLIIANLSDGSGPSNPFGIPPAVPGAVSATQIIAMFITVITQDDLLTSTTYILGGYHASLQQAFPNATRSKYYIIAGIQFMTGLLGLIVTFLLVIISSNVIDLILNFTAIEFITFLDNTSFVFAALGFAGKANQQQAKRIRTQWFTVPAKTKFKALQVVLISLTFLALMAGWIVIYIQQFRGVYLPQTLVVQFDDNVRSDLGAFSGKYHLEKNFGLPSVNGHRRIMYREGTKSRINTAVGDIVAADDVATADDNDNGRGIIAFCEESSSWTFRISGNDPCDANNIAAKSATTKSFDITTSVSDQPWFVAAPRNTLTSRFFRMDTFVLSIVCDTNDDCGTDQRGKCIKNECICNDGFYGIRCRYQEANTCELLEVDLNRGRFEAARSVSQFFRPIMLQSDTVGLGVGVGVGNIDMNAGVPVLAYEHPVYITTNDDIPLTERDLLIYTGMRWVLTQANALVGISVSVNNDREGERNLNKILGDFFESFHASTLLNRIEFISQQIEFGSPNDDASPIDINWFDGNNQDLSTVVPSVMSDAVLFCGICNNITNPCRNGNVCTEIGKCDCEDGSLGSLCQTAPVSNGKCDFAFNIPSFNYDGGDCCEGSCLRMGVMGGSASFDERNLCGTREIAGEVRDIGYPLCMNPEFRCQSANDNKECFLPNGQDVTIPQGANVRLSSNGRILAVLSSRLNTLVLYDKVGAQWIQRGSAIEGNGEMNFGISFGIWTPSGSVERVGSGLLPVILAVGGLDELRVFRWTDDDLEWTQVGSRIDLSFLKVLDEPSFGPESFESVDVQLGLTGRILTVMVGPVFEEASLPNLFANYRRFLLRNDLQAQLGVSWRETETESAPLVTEAGPYIIFGATCPPCPLLAAHQAVLSADGQTIAQSLLVLLRPPDAASSSNEFFFRVDRNSVQTNRYEEVILDKSFPTDTDDDLIFWPVRMSLSRDGSRLSTITLTRSKGLVVDTKVFSTGTTRSFVLFSNQQLQLQSSGTSVDESQLKARFYPGEEALWIKRPTFLGQQNSKGIVSIETYDFDDLNGWKNVGKFNLTQKQQNNFDVSSDGNMIVMKQTASTVSSRYISCPIDHKMLTFGFKMRRRRLNGISWYVDEVRTIGKSSSSSSPLSFRYRPLRVCQDCYDDDVNLNVDESWILERLCLSKEELQCLRLTIDLREFDVNATSSSSSSGVTVFVDDDVLEPLMTMDTSASSVSESDEIVGRRLVYDIDGTGINNNQECRAIENIGDISLDNMSMDESESGIGGGVVSETQEANESPMLSITECQDGHDSIIIGPLLDHSPQETRWILQNENGDKIYLNVGNYNKKDALSTPLKHVCIPSNECLLLQVIDDGGDGICCTPDLPFVILMNEEEEVNLGYSGINDFVNGTRYVGRFGKGCEATNAPSPSPSISSSPTISASPTITGAPSGMLVCDDDKGESILRLRFDVPNGAIEELRFNILDRSFEELLSERSDISLSKQMNQLWQLCVPRDECFLLNLAGGIEGLEYMIEIDDEYMLNGTSVPIKQEIQFGPNCLGRPFLNPYNNVTCDSKNESIVEGVYEFDSHPTSRTFTIENAGTGERYVDLLGEDFRGFSNSRQTFQACVPRDACLAFEQSFGLDHRRGGTYEIYYNGEFQFSIDNFRRHRRRHLVSRRLLVAVAKTVFPEQICSEV